MSNGFHLPDETHIGYVHLRVSDLERSLRFYETLVGLKRARESGTTVSLTASKGGPIILILSERRGARPKPARSTGLYHTAIRFPNRRELAKVFYRLYRNDVAFQGFSDHLVSEAIYLADPDENGVELYADRPRAEWVIQEKQIQMATQPLDIDSLVAELSESDTHSLDADPGTDIGHVHLHVSDLSSAEKFFHALVGFDVTQRSYPGALFLSAGGYHHHVGVNVWAGKGAPPSPSDAAGLIAVGVEMPDENALKVLAEHFTDSSSHFEHSDSDVLKKRVLRIASPDNIPLEIFSRIP